ncbi:PREDICTED: PRUPE_3G029000 [Prunus dulcis]|uniref:PREDICTED: PRUPE_3G029000 n=1 Tax=Prunus dulcis TaxID=3755 RepID=A0A5E4G952_PRUDU|nr:PREDICTED: PRUPE_3G029000 [Prunus dulcis]
MLSICLLKCHTHVGYAMVVLHFLILILATIWAFETMVVSTGMDACLGILLILFSTADYKLRWVCFKKLCYIHNQQFILVACSFSVLSSSSLLFSLIHLFRVVSRLGFDFCSSFVFSGDSFGRGVEGLEAVRGEQLRDKAVKHLRYIHY